MEQNPDAVDQEEMAFAETPASHNDPGDESDVVAETGAVDTQSVADETSEAAAGTTPAAVPPTPVGDYAEILTLMMQLQKRHSRNIFDNVSMRWWMRMQEICRTHS